MGLETGSYIAELNATNPAGSDAVSSGDDHIRLLKTCITGSFGAFVGTAASPVSVTLTEAQINDATLKSANNTLSGDNTFSGTNGFAAITATTYDGITAANLLDKSASETISGTYTIDAVLSDEVAGVGWKGTPQVDKAIDYTLVLGDAGKQIYLSGGASKTLTIPANASVAFPIGTVLIVINDSGNDWTIAITTDTLEPYGGTAGSQTLGDNEKAVLEKVTATLWKYSSTD